MFTGIVEEIGEVLAVREHAEVVVLTVRGRTVTSDAAHGDSIAVNGVCLTVTDPAGSTDGTFTVELVPETLKRTSLSAVAPGAGVNLERAMVAGGRLGGHIVQGHVDGVGTVRAVARSGDAVLVDVSVPSEIAELLVPHGSITVDGVSLTVNAIPQASVVQLSLIEYTLRHTTLGDLKSGDAVHVEGDVIGKYVRQLMTPYMRESGIGNRESKAPGVPGFRFPIPDSP